MYKQTGTCQYSYHIKNNFFPTIFKLVFIVSKTFQTKPWLFIYLLQLGCYPVAVVILHVIKT